MAIIVKEFSVNTGKRIYLPGESISELNKEQEQALVDAGHCRFPESVQTKAEVKTKTPPADELPAGLIDLGKGWFQLPNGKKALGKKKALEAFAQLQAEQNPAGDNESDGSGPNTELPT